MPLDATKANAVIAAINEAFAAIGNSDDTGLPRSKRNTEPAAWEFHVAAQLARLAEARKKKAHAAAVRAGLIADHEKDPMPAGTSSQVIYVGDVVEIAVTVTAASTRIDAESLIGDLEKAGVARKLLDKLTAKHTRESRAPHKFTSSLITT